MVVRRLLAAYDSLLARHRLRTGTVSGAVLSGAGDFLVQRASHDEFDVDRLAAFTIFGAALTGPINYVWLSTLERLVVSMAPSGGVRALVSKTIIQSVFFQPFVCVPASRFSRHLTRALPMPPCLRLSRRRAGSTLGRYLPTFYATNAIVRRWSAAEAVEHVRGEFVGTLTKLWLFWTPTVVFAFGALPVRRQAVFFAGIGFAWNVVLSWFAGEGPRRELTDARLASQPTPVPAARRLVARASQHATVAVATSRS